MRRSGWYPYEHLLAIGRAFFCGLVAKCDRRKINYKSLTEKTEATSPPGRFVFHVFALAEFERNLIRERTVAGLKAARAAALPEARPFKLSPKEIKTTRTLLKSADIPVAEIAARFYIARSTLYRAILKPAADPQPLNRGSPEPERT